ncbi:hypothetical protein BS78_10G061600 [Paspalum vaginatum]|nr:hypothetical protein BS78_10G061600 [Paspalum vaginatum]
MADESWRVPTPVQELASAAEEPPSRYVLREQDRPGRLLVADDMPEPIPVVDLSRLPDDDAEAAKLRSALQSWGLVLVSNHGIEAALMDEVMDASREFFHQPLEEKQKYSKLIDGKRFQIEGYGNDPVVSEDQILNWNDRLYLKVEPEDERNYAEWPKHPESFRPPTHLSVEVLNGYALKTKIIRDGILRAMSRILELDEDYFVSQISDKEAALARFNYYPPCPKPDLVNGVQRDGIWYNVPSQTYTLLINLGDVMEVMCNGVFKSPVHRVVTNSVKERISLAMFYGMVPEKAIEPAAGLVDEKRPARYRKIDAMDFFAGLQEHFARGTRFIESLKI